MQNINEVIQKSLSEIDFEEIVRQAAVEKVKETVKYTVEQQFKSYSNFSKQLEDHVSKELSFDFSRIKLPAYRDFVITQVNNALVSFTGEEHAREIIKHINKNVVGEHRDEIEFSVFWDELCEKIEESCDDEDNEKFHIELVNKDSSYSSRAYFQLTISQKKESYSSRSKDQSEIMYFAFSDGAIYHSRQQNEFELSHIYTWLKALQFRKTKILNIANNECSIPDRDY